ncbi:4Fe-4S dicluster domain-containing protein [Myxococcota bacterium]
MARFPNETVLIMGHIAAKTAYLNLQQRLDRMPIGAPAHRAFFDLLETLFSPEECRVAAAIPLKLANLDQIAKGAELPERRTSEVLEGLADKGLVVDLPRGNKPTLYFLNPTVIGFIEFTMMRVTDVDHKRAAELIWQYMFEDPGLAFMRMVGGGDTFVARPLVHEDALEPEVCSEVLDFQSATEIVDRAGAWAESVCHCRHVKLHHGKQCSYPLEHCLSLGRATDWMVRRRLAKPISHTRAREILEHARDHGCVQMADNVKNHPTFVCNCCKCCCELMEGFRALPHMAKVVSSSYVAELDAAKCNGCGKCAKACPIDVITMVPAEPTPAVPKRKKRSQLDPAGCLGCGVCHGACKFDGIRLRRANKRVHTPEDRIERMTLQAIERGKVQHLLFNDPKRLTHRTLGAFLGVLLKLPPAKQALANQQLKSRFVEAVMRGLGVPRRRRSVSTAS